jgi:Ca-activated chloride channel homolog
MRFVCNRSGRRLLVIAMELAFWSAAFGQPNPAPQTPAPGQAPPASSAPTSKPGGSPAQPPGTLEQSGQPAAPQDSIGLDPTGQDQGRFVFKKDVQEVVLHATVVDETGRLVTSLDRNAFSIYQNGIAEPITSFRREDVPVAMGIVIDNSGSMREKRAEVNRAVLNLIRASNTQDEIFVVNFSQTPYLDQDFTSDVNLLQAALHQTSTRGSTALYDAVVASAVHLQHNPGLEKKVLLVITDGQDNMSRETLEDAMRKLQQNKGPVVYAIGLTAEEFTPAGHDALQHLATATGGVAFFPSDLTSVDQITRSVAHDIRSQYTLAYKPQNLKPGYQAIRVEAKLPGHRLTVRTRSGYFPGEAVR